MMKLTTVKELYKNQEAYIDQTVEIGGWIRNVRDSKTFGFLVINDGTYFQTLQVVYDNKLDNFDDICKLNVGAAVIVRGKLVATPNAKRLLKFRLSRWMWKVHLLRIIHWQPKRHSFEYLRTITHLRPRTNTFQAVFRVRSLIAYAIHKFFQERDFVYVHTPLITGVTAKVQERCFR